MLVLNIITHYLCIYIFRGGGPGCNSVETNSRLSQLKKDLAELEALERQIDKHKQCAKQSIDNVRDELSNQK